MEECGRCHGCCFSRRDIKNSKFISKARKHHLLHQKRHATCFFHRKERTHAMATFILNHNKSRTFARLVGDGPFFRADTKVVTGLLFGRLIFKTFSDMLSEYFKIRNGVDLEVVEVLGSYKGITAAPDHTQCAKWFHVNFKARRKDDDGGDNEKVYFAEVAVFVFGYSPVLCHVNACLPVDHDAAFGNSCRCLFHSCPLKHPSIKAYKDDRLLAPVFSSILLEAKDVFNELVRTRSRHIGKQCVWLDTKLEMLHIPFCLFQPEVFSMDTTPCDRDRTAASMEEAPTKYLYQSCKMSEDLLVPKKIGLLGGKRQGTNPEELQRRAVVMAKHIENWRKPWMCPRIRKYLKVLAECYRKKYAGLELEGVSDLIISEEPYHNDTWTKRATWIHMNFRAKTKNENGDGGVYEEQLYFAEVVYPYNWVTGIEDYHMTVCALVENAGKASKCGICKPDVQIYHPSKEDYDYIDDPSKMSLSPIE
ncbi:hypothetical protein M5689_022128 [Euphorbia peplus]|nr:hypothetical protein M5689_022128 [Euphorbia peplus]